MEEKLVRSPYDRNSPDPIGAGNSYYKQNGQADKGKGSGVATFLDG